MQVLEDWWKPKVEGCRRLRSRKSWAATVIGRWVIRLVTRRRQSSIRASKERSARMRQRQWRQLSIRILEHRRLATSSEACVLVQTAWRARRLERLQRSKVLRLKISVGLEGWARVLNARRRKTAAEVALGAALAASKRRQKRKRRAAEIVARALKTACNLQRNIPPLPQRDPCKLCLLPAVPVAQTLQRRGLVQRRAATIIQRARRNAVARWAANANRISLVRTLQEWFRKVLRNWERRRSSVVVVQRAWRRARQRRAHSVLRKILRVTDYGLHDVFGSAIVEGSRSISVASAAEVGDINVAPWGETSGVNVGDPRQEVVACPHVNGPEIIGETDVSGDVSDRSSASILCSPCHTTSTRAGYSPEIVGLEGENICAYAPVISDDDVLSQATTAHEDWGVLVVNPAEGDVASCCSGKDSGQESESNEQGCTDATSAATTVMSPSMRNTNSRHTRDWCHAEETRIARNSSYSARGDQAVDQAERTMPETRDQCSGMLSLDMKLCDIIDTKRPKGVSRRVRKRQGQPEVQCPCQASNSPTAVWSNEHRILEANNFPLPSAVGGQSTDSSRATGVRVNLTVAQARPNMATSYALRSRRRPHIRCQGPNFVDNVPLPQNMRTHINSALGLGLGSGGGRDAFSGNACGGSRARALPGSGKRAKGKPKTSKGLPCPGGGNSTRRSRKRVPRTGDSPRQGVACGISSTCYNGESGAVLQMLASLEG